MTSEMEQQPRPLDGKGADRPSHDGLAAVAIALLTVGLIAFAIIQII